MSNSSGWPSTNSLGKSNNSLSMPSRSSSISGSQPSLRPARRSSIEDEINEIIRNRKIFYIRNLAPMYNFPVLREELLKRGWLEKHNGENYGEMVAASKEVFLKFLPTVMKNVEPNFIWTNAPFNKYYYGKKYPLYSRLVYRKPENDFSNKLGLSHLAESINWFKDEGAPEIYLPRSYVMGSEDVRQEFLKDYILSTCTHFLLNLLDLKIHEVFSQKGRRPTAIINFALEALKRAVDDKSHGVIDSQGETPFIADIQQFNDYKADFEKIIKDKELFKMHNDAFGQVLMTEIYFVVSDVIQHFPYILRDKQKNLWILKPAASKFGCGYGIALFNNNESIISYCNRYSNTLHIVQKYLESPFLIYKTKFDIRQYFLIAMNEKFMSVWMYKNCYLKFSSQEYDHRDLSRSIHVTNYTVQQHYTNGVRSKELPVHNMWVLSQFKEYLVANGLPTVWDSQIYPEMVTCIKAVLEGTSDAIEFMPNNFQLFGADFMITSDHHPVLIEINGSPDLSHSTASTEEVCTAVVQDLVKVLLDFPQDETSSTGEFEQIFECDMVDFCPTRSPKFDVVGVACKLNSPTSQSSKTSEKKSAPNVKPVEKKKVPFIDETTLSPPESSSLKAGENYSVNGRKAVPDDIWHILHELEKNDINVTKSTRRSTMLQTPISRSYLISNVYEGLNKSAEKKRVPSITSSMPAAGVKKKKTSSPKFLQPPSNMRDLGNGAYISQSRRIILDYVRSRSTMTRTSSLYSK